MSNYFKDERCPQCHRFGYGFAPQCESVRHCAWTDCGYQDGGKIDRKRFKKPVLSGKWLKDFAKYRKETSLFS